MLEQGRDRAQIFLRVEIRAVRGALRGFQAGPVPAVASELDADVLIAFERLEALRYAHFLKKDGVLIVNDERIDPMPVVTGAAEYPENILENLSKERTVYSIDAMAEAKKLGSQRVFNLVVLGMAAKHMDFTAEQWNKIIEKTVPPKTVDINLKAFERGYAA